MILEYAVLATVQAIDLDNRHAREILVTQMAELVIRSEVTILHDELLAVFEEKYKRVTGGELVSRLYKHLRQMKKKYGDAEDSRGSKRRATA